jgi:hypothetical protein
LILVPLAARADGPAEARVYVILWFDTEDYLLPADDDATLRISEFLTREGIRCTHKLVGEKARVLERRGRKDVIAALEKHEIGYHTDYHSVQPTPALFLSRQGWDDGVAEFDRRERQGLDDVERITGQKPTCYGQPGSSWGPQQFGAIRRWGVPVYLDAGSHVKLGGDPFWYCGILNLYALKATLRTGLGGPQDLEPARRQFDEWYEKLLAEGGGPVSIFYHPCEFVHKQFWDGVNFARGANPPRSEWQIPPHKTPEESRVAYETFESYIRYIREHPRVEFVTASKALELYRDRSREHQFTAQQMRTIAQAASSEISFVRLGDVTLAPAEVLDILVQFVRPRLAGGLRESVQLRGVLDGPTLAAPEHAQVTTTRSQFERTLDDVDRYLDRHKRIPNAVWLGSTPVSPESFLSTLAWAALELAVGKELAGELTFKPTDLAAAQYVSEDTARLWGWVIFPPGFRAPEMMQLAKRQAWTLKPAVLTAE